MTPEEAWLGMDGATAWHLIDRHAEDWSDVGEKMAAWYLANSLPEIAEAVSDEREICASLLELRDSELLLMAGEMTAQELRTVQAVLEQLARTIRARSNVEAQGRAACGASLGAQC